MKPWIAPDKNLILENDWVKLSGIDPANDAEDLFAAASVEANQGTDLFTYLPIGPFTELSQFEQYLQSKDKTPGDFGYKVLSKRLKKLVGAVHLMNTKEQHGCVEVGSIWYNLEAQRTEINTNTMALLFNYVFDELNYRRLEWKCDNNNEASKKAAIRLGFSAEGLFRQHLWVKNKNRDTAWFSIIDSDWLNVKLHLNDLLDRT
jgi:RimJ/RimL family protein N-acetyltransferase